MNDHILKKKQNNYLINCIVLLILFLVSFFRCRLIPFYLYNSEERFLIVQIVLFFALYNYNYKGHIMFKKIFVIYAILIVINCITCLHWRGQDILVSLYGWNTFFLIFFYPVFKSWNFSLEIWEKVLYRLFIIILAIYIFMNIFPYSDLFLLYKASDTLEREMRIRVYSSGVLYLGTIYCWNKYLLENDKVKLLLYVLGFLMIFLQGFRNLIAALVLVSVIMYIRIFGFSKKSISISLCVILIGIGSLYIPLVQDKIAEITNRIDRDTENGVDRTRALDLHYAYNSHFISNIELFFGSGMPIIKIKRFNDGTKVAQLDQIPSSYSRHMTQKGVHDYFYTHDLGILGLSWIAGIPFAVLFIILLIKLISTKVDPQYYYLGMFSLFLLLSGLTNGVSYHQNNLIFLSLALILLDLSHQKYKSENSSHKTTGQFLKN